MGGARCAYRTCTSRTEPSKKTHFFHFPVFDKVRCHQWISNAQRLDFLDLKIAQLKNRVICQHHFKDDNFMNYMNDKLKNTAVPTEDGPNCTTPTVAQEDKELPINLDDIENDYLPRNEKKAHFSVKYGEFLTNDFSESINLLPTYNSSIKLQDQGLIFHRKGKYRPQTRTINNLAKNISEKEAINIEDVHKTTIPDPTLSMSQLQQSLPDPKIMSIQFEDINLTEPVKAGSISSKKLNEQKIIETSVFPSHRLKPVSTQIPLNKKVKIISEKKISEPVKLKKSEFQSVSPSIVLKMVDRTKKQNVPVNGTEAGTFYLNITNPEEIAYIQGYDNSKITCQNPVNDQIYMNQYDIRMPVEQFHDTLQVQNSQLFTDDKKQLGIVTTEPNQETKLEQEAKLFTLEDLHTITNVPIEYIPVSTGSVPQNSTVLADLTFVQNNFSSADNPPQQNASLLSANSESLLKTTARFKEDQVVYKQEIENKSNKLNTQNTEKSLLQNCVSPINKKTNKSLLKNKMAPEKLAAIEEKRKFNMKLRDVIESCLNKLEDDADTSKLAVVVKRSLSEKNVGKHLSEGTNLPSPQENQIAYLEARLQRMEDTLLNKIEQNSLKINDLKRTIKPAKGKKSAYTQTCSNPETTKRNLYEQISQFLSPEVNGLLYEELFVSSVLQDESNNVQFVKKRRKR